MKTLALLLAVGLMAVSMPVFAADPFIDQLADIASGRHDQCDTRAYVAYTVKDTFALKGIPILPKGLRIKASTALGQDFMEVNMVEIGIEF